MAQLKLLAASPQAPLPCEHFQEWRTGGGEIHATFHRMAYGYVVRFPGRADFVVANESELVTCTPTGLVSEQIVRFLFANQIVPLLQNRAGKLVLHASAIACAERVLGFVGQSGRGKSTLAAAFARAGHPFLTDDGLLVESNGAEFLVKPNQPNLRLWYDSYDAVLRGHTAPPVAEENEKRRIDASAELPFQDRPLGLHAIYLLGPGDTDSVIVSAMAPPAAFAEILQHAFILDIEDRARMRLQWEQMGDLAERVPCFALDYPRRYEGLDRVLDAILDHACIGASAP